jgi:PAS domain S-box-containing protein
MGRTPPTSEGRRDDRDRRLEEAEATLDAIRAGEVDAVVVDGHRGQQVYTLESPDQPFRVFVEQMQEGALTVTHERVIVYSNARFAQLLTMPLEQVMGAQLDDLIAPASHRAFLELMSAASSGQAHGEIEVVDSAGHSIPVGVSVGSLPSNTIPTFGIVIADLTEPRRAKELETAHLAALEANRARDQFLAVISHELRTPLNAVLGWAQLLRQNEPLDERMSQGLQVIERNARAQAQLIDDLLDVSRMLAGKLRLEVRPFDLREIVEASVASISPVAAAKGVEVTCELEPGADMIEGDPHRLQQVIWNLLSNAVKATGPGGRVAAATRQRAETIEIEVSDNGRGMPRDLVAKVFDAFTQGEPAGVGSSNGLGLGLSIVKQIVEMHGGTVVAQSDGLGRGSRFVVRLPRSATAVLGRASQSTPPPSVGVDLSGLRVLVVDDDPDARALLEQMIASRGALPFVAANAREALAILAEHAMDVLLSDIGMPDIDGYELIRRVRASGRDARSLPAVALTAFARNQDRRRALLAGFQLHVAKPVESDELYAVLASVSGRTALL